MLIRDYTLDIARLLDVGYILFSTYNLFIFIINFCTFKNKNKIKKKTLIVSICLSVHLSQQSSESAGPIKLRVRVVIKHIPI